MIKISRREAMTFLLGGLAALGGITTSSEKSSLPKECVRRHKPKQVTLPLSEISRNWEVFPYWESRDKRCSCMVIGGREAFPHLIAVSSPLLGGSIGKEIL